MTAGDKSRFAILANQLEKQGLSHDEALTAAATELFIKEPLVAGGHRALTAAIFSIPATAQNNAALREAAASEDVIAPLLKTAYEKGDMEDFFRRLDEPYDLEQPVDEVEDIGYNEGEGTSEGAGDSITGLPKTTKESVDTKLSTYLLNSDHPAGGSKAKWFKEALGFTKDNSDDLAQQILFDPQKAASIVTNAYGTKFSQIIPIKGANGRVIDVEFIWIKNNDGIIRLVTSIPTKK